MYPFHENMNTKFENINILSMKLGFPQTGKFKECLLFSNKVISCLCEKQHFTFLHSVLQKNWIYIPHLIKQRFFRYCGNFSVSNILKKKKINFLAIVDGFSDTCNSPR